MKARNIGAVAGVILAGMTLNNYLAAQENDNLDCGFMKVYVRGIIEKIQETGYKGVYIPIKPSIERAFSCGKEELERISKEVGQTYVLEEGQYKHGELKGKPVYIIRETD